MTNVYIILKTYTLTSINTPRNTNGEADNNDSMNTDVPKNSNNHEHVKNNINTNTNIHTIVCIN